MCSPSPSLRPITRVLTTRRKIKVFLCSPDLKLGTIQVIGEVTSALPIEHINVHGQFTGPIASVEVQQQFGNPFRTPIDLDYLFPLPHQAALVEYQIRIGERAIRAEIQELHTARQQYQEPVEAGQRASLLEERRPNLFAIRIGNVQPGDNIVATIRYEETLHYADGTFAFVFPMGVTPKYHADPAEAANVDSPIAQVGERIAPVELTLDIEPGVQVEDPTSTNIRVTNGLWLIRFQSRCR
jgi:Ca-activated chloride channel homolog